MDTTKTNFLTMALSKENHEIARKFSGQQDTVEKGKQVYLNTLAVLGVRSFLDWLGIETDLNAGDSWHPVVRCFNDVADLVIPNLGKIECRPVLPGETVISLPSEVTENRIAYIGVQFQEQLNEVQLLGFYPTTDPQTPLETIEITSLQPIETLIDYLDRLESALDFFQSNDPVAAKVKQRLNDESFSEIVTQLERIYRTYKKYERRYAGGEFLASYLTVGGLAFRGGTVAAKEYFDESQQNELQDLAEELLEKLAELWGGDESEETVNIEPIVAPLSQDLATVIGVINLSQWLQNIESAFESAFESNWQTLESFLSELQGNLIFRFATTPRSSRTDAENPTLSVSKVSKITLGDYPVALIVNCQQKSDDKRDILVRLYPRNEAQNYLPPATQLIILDENGEVFLEAESRNADNWIQLDFRGVPGEQFSVKVALGDANIVENFVI
ncbi:DUF1822 family protein [Planktothricoides raciborskii]|uniref:DUF1822 family protein n=1 Tax=Planktothricoides raciborskii GIHE-MW2 TaxID=2792601 RepID=A0AAU8J615_9CYAN